MAVNNMTKEQAYQLIALLHQQATGENTIQPTDLSSFISVAQATLAVGTEQTLNAISQVIGRTLIAVRAYDEKFKGLEFNEDTWGGIIRKINYVDTPAEADPTHATADGYSIDQYVVRKPKVLETRYVGSDVWMGAYTIYRVQLETAFQNEASFGSFMTGLMTHFLNERTQWFENLKRSILANAIASVKLMNNSDQIVHLLSEYNTITGASPAFTAQTIMQPANFKPFMQWAYSRVAEVSELMTERSGMFQQPMVDGSNNLIPINRHTPYEMQRAYFTAQFLNAMDAQVLADTYHPNFLTYSDVEPVAFWQSIKTPMSISAKPVYVDTDGTVKVGASNQVVSAIVGLLFDRDCMGYNIFRESLEASPYNAEGQYYNLFAHADVQLQYDPTEKCVLFLLD